MWPYKCSIPHFRDSDDDCNIKMQDKIKSVIAQAQISYSMMGEVHTKHQDSVYSPSAFVAILATLKQAMA